MVPHPELGGGSDVGKNGRAGRGVFFCLAKILSAEFQCTPFKEGLLIQPFWTVQNPNGLYCFKKNTSKKKKGCIYFPENETLPEHCEILQVHKHPAGRETVVTKRHFFSSLLNYRFGHV